MSRQSYTIPARAVLIDDLCELDGCWLETIPMMNMSSIVNEIQRYLNQQTNEDMRSTSRTSDVSTTSRVHVKNVKQIRHVSVTYLNRPVSDWSASDVAEWCGTTQGSFETLQPLIMRLNGPALVHLAEILSIEPASMYHSLNTELLQRTGTSVPLTEYVALRSELEQLLANKPSQRILDDDRMTPTTDHQDKNQHRRKRWKHSRLCTII
jgi:hypothetical protein